MNLSRYNKFYVSFLGFAAEVANMNLLHGTVQHYLVAGIGVLTAAGVFFVPNTQDIPPTSPAVVINP